MKPSASIFVCPLLCMGLLAGIARERRHQVQPETAEPFHARAKAAIDAIPLVIGDWTAQDEPIPPEAIRLLHPNEIICRRYVDNSLSSTDLRDRWATLLVDQCKDARDMQGHWPPNCYVNSGQMLVGGHGEERDWQVDDLLIPGMEYHFVKLEPARRLRQVVYNFLIVPGTGIVRDMQGVRAAAADYQARYYGAAQFQVLMSADLSREQRDEIFKTLMSACVPTIKTLKTMKAGEAR